MNFLKKNLFYVILVGVTLAVVVVCAVVMSSLTDKTDSGKQVRSDLLSRISRLSNQRTPVNDASIKQEESRVALYSGQAATVAEMSVERNRRPYMDLMIRYSATDSAVFPLADDVFKAKGSYRASQYYLDKVEELKKQLKATAPATPAELKAEEERIAAQISATAPASPTGGVATPAPTPGGGPGYMNPGVGPRMPGVGAPGNTGTPEQAKTAADLAFQSMRTRKANDGRVFVLDNAIEKSFTKETDGASAKDLWTAQTNLWLLGDILAAINATNEEALRVGGQVKKDTVPNSAVKLIEKIKIYDGYVVSGAAPASGGPATPGGVPAPVYGGGFGNRPPMAPATPMAPMAPAAPTGGDATPSADSGGAVLGDRSSNKDYDVLKYDVVVIMPARYVNAFIRNLVNRNYHLITNVEMVDIADEPASPYYFGIEPVMRVTLNGQALLLTVWERGLTETDKAGKKTVKYPSLMPVDVLQSLPESVRRPEDVERLTPRK